MTTPEQPATRPIPWTVPAVLADRLLLLDTTLLSTESMLGERYAGNLRRLLEVDMEPRLAGFREKPGSHVWIGEHVGKWIHAATLVWHATGDIDLRRKLDETVTALIATQESDGYLGTYLPADRFGLNAGAEWDVWTHKYCLIGLLTYHRYTSDEDALAASRRVADLLIHEFGPNPGQRDILAAGIHVGMTATSVLEPVVQLYRLTGTREYLAFAEYLIDSWDRPGGPRILSTLLADGRVSRVGNGKAYEILSNLVGLVEYAKVTGDAHALGAVERAWHDVVEHHLFLTGTASFFEHFNRPDELPDSLCVDMGETCVTVTWLQLSLQLLALTASSGFAGEVERTLFNHLAGAQLPDGSAWCYYTPMDGVRDYGAGISCCISSGPRGIALAPSAVFATTAAGDELVVSLYQDASVHAELGGGAVDVRLTTAVPYRGGARLSFDLEGERTFGVRLRRPAWARDVAVSGGGASETEGWIVVPPRSYRSGDALDLDFELGWREIAGERWNAGRTAFAWGPLVLGYRAHGDLPGALDSLDPEAGTPDFSTPHVARDWSVLNRRAPGGRRAATIAPFAEIGADGAPSRVWLENAPLPGADSVFAGARESLSAGKLRGSVNDGSRATFASTADPRPHDEVWIAVEADAPVEFSRIVMAHGRTMFHGGWFDTSGGKPQLQIRESPDADWTTIAGFDDYPDTDALRSGGLIAGEAFEVTLTAPVLASGIRVLGRGSMGEFADRGWRYATCSELTAFAE